jgi:tripartite-type tricarboxylate transporter receptor subunit TctC
MLRGVTAFVLAAVVSLLAGAPPAAAYPDRPVTIVVPFAAGGPSDVIARIFGEYLSRALGQQMVIENVTGAGGTVGAIRVMRSAPDGYTLLAGNLGTQAASVGLYPNLAYDPRTDFEHIILTASTPMLVVGKKDLPVKDFREFVTYAKANDTRLNYGTGGVGATSHLTCLFLDYLLGTKVTHVPFRGSGPALQALIAGQIDYVCDQTVGIVPSIQGGLVKGLVIATPGRSPVLPNVPTSEEQGLPNFKATGWNLLLAPKGTPAAIADQLNAAAVAALKDDGVRKRLLDLGAELPAGSEQTRAYALELVRTEIDKWVPVIKAAGVVVN